MALRKAIGVSASILAADFALLGEAAREAERAGATSIHIDVMDGHYVHNLTFGIDLLPALRKYTNLPLMAHLELDNPDAFIKDFAHAGADTIIVCEDTCPDLGATIRALQSAGVHVGVSLNPDRPLDPVVEHVESIDFLLMLSVFPGFGGQKFMHAVLPKMAAARALLDKMSHPPVLGCDGGINRETLPAVVQAGAETLIIGSALFAQNAVAGNMQEIRRLIAMSQQA